MNYRALQQQLKALRNNGFYVRCKLNAKKAVLEAEWNRLQGSVDTNPPATPQVQQQPQVNMTYRDLQSVLSNAKKAGKTNIKINSSKDVLVAEWLRISQDCTTTNRRFGVELEFNEPSERNWIGRIKGILRNEGITVMRYPGAYDTSIAKHWRLMTDGSCGYELVSPPLDLYDRASYTEITYVMNAIRSIGGTVDDRCGLHVHIEATDLTVTQIKNWLWAYASKEEQLDKLVPEHRRGDNHRFCQSNMCSDLYLHTLDRCKTVKDICNKVVTTRYHKFNTHSFIKYGTIEIRHLHGTLDIDVLTNWIWVQTKLMYEATGVTR